MRFLVVTKSAYSIPMEAAGMLLEATKGWLRQNKANKKIEQAFAFAGVPAGAVILNVNTLEELEAIMAEYPLGQFSDTQIHALTDMEHAFDLSLNAFKKMAPEKR